MRRTQIYPTEEERRALRALARRLGTTQSELIRRAIDAYVERFQAGRRVELISRARGMWADREDLPDWEALRGEMDRTREGQ